MTALSLRIAALLACIAAPALAQEGPGLAFTLGAGVGSKPGYFGSSESDLGPSLSLSDGFLSFGPLRLGDSDPTAAHLGFGFRGSFRYVPSRTSDEFPELAGLDDIDAAFELGGGVQYTGAWWEAYAVARTGLGGHHDLVGEVGMDLIARPTDRLELRAGPRLTLGSDGYAQTYFGVSQSEAAASAFPAYDASGGLLASGVEVGATYQLGESWGVSASARYDRLQNDAAQSPITQEDGQVSASVELTRRFDFRF